MALRVRWPLVVTCIIDLTDHERRKGILFKIKQRAVYNYSAVIFIFYVRCEVIQHGRTKTFTTYNL